MTASRVAPASPPPQEIEKSMGDGDKSRLDLPQKRQAILVMGMHRSGTSALAGALHVLGAAAPKTLMPANAHNLRGFWESVPLVEIHEQLLASVGSVWHDWRLLNAEWQQSAAALGYREKLKQAITHEFGDDALIVVKDPRICRFAKLFSSIMDEMGIELVALLPIRNPLEVAYSLHRRDAITLPKALLLWLRHVLDAERDTREMRRCFIAHDRLLNDWRHELARASALTALTWPSRSTMVDAKVDAFLTQELYHERATLTDILEHPTISSWVSDTYRILTIFSAEGETNELIGELDQIRARFDEGSAIFGAAAVEGELAAERERAAHSKSQSDLQRIAGELQHVTAKAEELGAALARVQIESERLNAALARQAMENHALVAARDAAGSALARQAMESHALVAARDAAGSERDRARADRDSANAALKAVYASLSWRATALPRKLSNWFGR